MSLFTTRPLVHSSCSTINPKPIPTSIPVPILEPLPLLVVPSLHSYPDSYLHARSLEANRDDQITYLPTESHQYSQHPQGHHQPHVHDGGQNQSFLVKLEPSITTINPSLLHDRTHGEHLVTGVPTHFGSSTNAEKPCGGLTPLASTPITSSSFSSAPFALLSRASHSCSATSTTATTKSFFSTSPLTTTTTNIPARGKRNHRHEVKQPSHHSLSPPPSHFNPMSTRTRTERSGAYNNRFSTLTSTVPLSASRARYPLTAGVTAQSHVPSHLPTLSHTHEYGSGGRDGGLGALGGRVPGSHSHQDPPRSSTYHRQQQDHCFHSRHPFATGVEERNTIAVGQVSPKFGTLLKLD